MRARAPKRAAAGAAASGTSGAISRCGLPFRAPLNPENLFGHLIATGVPGVEEWRGGAYRRTLSLPDGHGVVALTPHPDHIGCRLNLTDPRDLTIAISRCRRLLDLDADPAAVDERVRAPTRCTRPTSARPPEISQVPEGRQVFARMTVTDNLRAGALGSTGSRTAKADALRRVLELFPVLADRGGQRAGLLSGGEQQMLAVGRALMASPRLLLLDKPSRGLAPLMAARIADTIREINAQGTSVLLVEQNAALALRLASHAYVLDVGEVALAGPADELAASDEVRRRYLGVVDEDAAADASQGLGALPELPRWEVGR
ncbi:hypothetical protein SALBM135S_10103 [Streptomyces alboniger]